MPFIQFQLRRGTAAEWACVNPILADGELGYETDTRLLKIGSNCKPWSQLPFLGVQGPTGPTGPPGPQGPQGVQGAAGVTGPTGSLGNQGSQGPQGPQGSQGSQGSIGPTGWTGHVGVQGAQGQQGSIGPIGPTGPTGQSGTNGNVGSQGPVGPTGAIGNLNISYSQIFLSYVSNGLGGGYASSGTTNIPNGVVYVNSSVLPPGTPNNSSTSGNIGLILVDVTNSGNMYQKAPIGYSLQANSNSIAGFPLSSGVVANVLSIQTGASLALGYYQNFLYINKASIGNVGLLSTDLPSTLTINLQYTT